MPANISYISHHQKNDESIQLDDNSTKLKSELPIINFSEKDMSFHMSEKDVSLEPNIDFANLCADYGY